MGDSASDIADDQDGYRYLCRKYSEKYVDLYSNHYYWLEEKDKGNTISYEDYYKEKEKKKLENQIAWKEQELERLKNQLDGK